MEDRSLSDRWFPYRVRRPFPMETTYTWEPVAPGRTRMTLRNRGTPTGFSAWVAPFMAYAIRRANRKDLAVLKQVLENRGVGA